MVRPELAKEGVNVRLRHPFSQGEGAHHFSQDQAAAAFPSRPLDDPAFPPEGPKLARLLGWIPISGGHVTL